MMKRGYFGIGIENTKVEQNIGTLFRGAHILGASFMFVIGERYKKQGTDTSDACRHTPLYTYPTFESFLKSMPMGCSLVGVELHEKSVPLAGFKHPERCVYLLGAEDFGLSKEALDKCDSIVQLPGEFSMNVSVVGSIVMYDRISKTK